MPDPTESPSEIGQMLDPSEVFGRPALDGDESTAVDDTVDDSAKAVEKTDETVDTAAKADDEQAADPASEPAQAFKIGETEIPRDEIEKVWEGREFIEHGMVWAGTLEHFNKGPEQAAEVIEQMINAAREGYGDKFLMPELPADLDEESLTDAEKVLNARTRRLEAENKTLRSEFAKTLAELRGTAQEKLDRDASAGWLAVVKSQYPDADVSPDQLTAWMREHKTKDPVVAYRLGTYDQVRQGQAKPEAKPAKEKPAMPRGTSGERFFDPYDPSHDLASIERMLAEGMQPDPNAKRR